MRIEKGCDILRIPKHIGIIPDGNRRWATKHGFKKEQGYDYGLSVGLELLREAKKRGIEEITYYGFTVDNCKRPKKQFEAFKKACVDAVELIASEGASLLVVGNTKSNCFPEELISFTKRKEVNGGGIRTNILVNYGWEWDLENGKDIKSKDVSRMDMIIRWGGMRRLSGFLPVQSVYADFFVVDEMWPDYNKNQFQDALRWYNKQDVTLGG